MTEIVNIFTAAQPAPPKEEPSFNTDELMKSFNQQRATDWTIGEAFMALHLAAANADGKISAEEQAELMALAQRSRALKSLQPQQLAQMGGVVQQRLHDRPDGLQQACESLPTDMRLTVFAHCVDLILADGELHSAEADFLNKITAYLGLQRADAERIQQVMLIKNRF